MPPRTAREEARTARWLVGATLSYNFIEAAVALPAGLEAGSLALFGFGLDSLIEIAAGSVVFLRLNSEARGADLASVQRSERRVHRFVGWTFLLLSAYIALQAWLTLSGRKAPEPSVVGIVLALLSLTLMPALAWAKYRAARRLGSRALRAEAKETLACSILSLTLLLGLGANALYGWWWADPVAALLMLPWLLMESRECLHAEGR